MSFAALKTLLTSDEFDRVRAFTAPPSDPVKAARLEGNTAHQVFHESGLEARSERHPARRRRLRQFGRRPDLSRRFGIGEAINRRARRRQAVVAELSRDIAAQITPSVEVTFEELVSDGKPVVVLHVTEGTHKPHAVAPGGIFVRRDAESAQATRDEIVQMVTGAAAEAPVAATSTPVMPVPAPSNGRARGEPATKAGAAPDRKPRSDTSRPCATRGPA